MPTISSNPSRQFSCDWQKTWRADAVAIVESLFPVTAAQDWDGLLDLRGALIEGKDWQLTLELFLACRASLEPGNYLPLYRLRQLISNSLRFEGGAGADATFSLGRLLRRPHRSLANLRRAQNDGLRLVEIT